SGNDVQKFYHAEKPCRAPSCEYRALRDAGTGFGSRMQRSRIGGNRRHIVDGQIGDDGLHWLNCRWSARTALNIEQLPHHIAWRTASQRRNLALASQVAAMAGGATKSFAGGSGRSRLSFP